MVITSTEKTAIDNLVQYMNAELGYPNKLAKRYGVTREIVPGLYGIKIKNKFLPALAIIKTRLQGKINLGTATPEEIAVRSLGDPWKGPVIQPRKIEP